MVMTRSPGSIILDMALSIVVLPEPVPPEMTTLNRHAPAIFSTVAILSDMEPPFAIMSMVIGFSENLRIEIAVPLSDRGGTMTLDRKSGAAGKRVSVRVDLGGSRIITKKKTTREDVRLGARKAYSELR